MNYLHAILRGLRARLDRINSISVEAVCEPESWISGSQIGGPVRVARGCKIFRSEISGNVSIGRFTSLWGPEIVVSGLKHGVTIGAFCSIARHGSMYETFHNTQRTTTYFVVKNLLQIPPRHDAEVSKGPIRIGNDVWIGASAQVMSGVSIGHGAVVGAGAIVTRDIPPFAVVGGNPARLIRYRFDPDVIDRLMEIEWWNWSEERLLAEREFLMEVHEVPRR